MIENVRGLLGLVQMGVLEIYPWGSIVDRLEQPDRLIFDLDPDNGLALDRVIASAVTVRETLRASGCAASPRPPAERVFTSSCRSSRP